MAAETYECIVSGTLEQQFVQNVLHVGVDNTAGTDPFTVATAILTKFNTSGQFVTKFLDCCPDVYAMTSLRVRKILPTGGPTAIILGAALNTTGGTRTGVVITTSSSPILILLSTVRPSKTGRIFFPGITATDAPDGILQGGIQTALTNFGNYMKAGGTLASPAYTWDGQIYRRAAHAGDPLEYIRISPIIGTQRRRQRPI